jgi:hypothetical protein
LTLGLIQWQKFHVDDVVQLRGAGTESRLRGMIQDTFYDQDDLENNDRIADVNIQNWQLKLEN